ncbi:MAG: hypothetical protein QGI78_04975, partial [Phycisphaerales bacterium]|jgi:hypothetical protein|nr:hypothetical protein [Phycisphaerales bacterium]
VHQAFGVLIDDEGNDTFKAMTAANQGSAWDIAAGCLLDKSGDDSYEANAMTQGSAQMQGIAYLIDVDGADSYIGTNPAQGKSGSNSYHFESTRARSFSFLLDKGGDEDSYSLERKNNSTEITHQVPRDSDGSSGVSSGDNSGVGVFIDR